MKQQAAAKVAEMRAARVEFEKAQAELSVTTAIVLHTAANILGLNRGFPLVFGEMKWECGKSPVGECLYDDEGDPMHDCCVCCGEPEERK